MVSSKGIDFDNIFLDLANFFSYIFIFCAYTVCKCVALAYFAFVATPDWYYHFMAYIESMGTEIICKIEPVQIAWIIVACLMVSGFVVYIVRSRKE